jgi:hypothetical protein
MLTIVYGAKGFAFVTALKSVQIQRGLLCEQRLTLLSDGSVSVEVGIFGN